MQNHLKSKILSEKNHYGYYSIRLAALDHLSVQWLCPPEIENIMAVMTKVDNSFKCTTMFTSAQWILFFGSKPLTDEESFKIHPFYSYDLYKSFKDILLIPKLNSLFSRYTTNIICCVSAVRITIL